MENQNQFLDNLLLFYGMLRLCHYVQASERSQNEPDERGQQTALCASGLHPNGTCSCDSFFMGEESGVLASISRIVVLAEALFEVDSLDHMTSLLNCLTCLHDYHIQKLIICQNQL